MSWLELTVRVAGRVADRTGELLSALGAVAVSVSAADHGSAGAPGVAPDLVLEPLPGEQPLWREVELTALLPTDIDLPALRAELAAAGIAIRDLTFLADRDWREDWRSHAARACFANRLWLLPRDEPVPAVVHADTGAAPGGPLPVLRLEPGLAFGSGSHPTTRLCLEWLGAADLAGKRVLDFGCGSGILALAACLLGAREVLAIDHDPQALVATRDNADYNGIAPGQLRVGAPEVLWSDTGRFDVVVANVLANPLIELAPRLAALLAPAGVLVLSGLLAEQEHALRAAYSGVVFAAPAREQEWIRLDGHRAPGAEVRTNSGAADPCNEMDR